MPNGVPAEASSASASSTVEGIVGILRKRGWLAADRDGSLQPEVTSWLGRAAEYLGPHAADQAALENLLGLVFNYDAGAILQDCANQAVLAREGARDVIRELANRVFEGGNVDSDRLKGIVDSMKTAVPYRSREMFHPLRVALAGRAGDGELDRVILLLDGAAKLPFAVPVKGTRQRMLEFCAALD